MWIHSSKTDFKRIEQEEIEKIFYQKNKKEREKSRKEMVSNFLGSTKATSYTTKRVSIVFGNHGRKKPFCIKIVYHKNASGFGVGILRLHFTYKTYENGKVTHLLPFEIYQRKKQRKLKEKERTNQLCTEDESNDESEEVPQENQVKKRKESKEDDPEILKKEMEELNQVIEENKKNWVSATVPSEELKMQIIREIEEKTGVKSDYTLNLNEKKRKNVICNSKKMKKKK